MRNFALFDGRAPLALLSFEADGSVRAFGSISVSADGSMLRVITNRPGHCVNNVFVVANSSPTWHIIPIKSVN